MVKLVVSVAALLMASGVVFAQDTALSSLDLKSALQIALRENAALAGARANAGAAGAAAKQARAVSGPSAALSSTYSFLSEETTFGGTPVLERNTQANRVEVQQVVYSGGALQAAIDRARYGAEAASRAAHSVEAEILTGVARAYFRTMQAAEGIDAARSSVSSLQASLDAARRLRDAGVVTTADVLRAEVALASARENLIDARNGHSVAIANLKKVMGVPQSSVLDISGVFSLPQQIDQIQPAVRPDVAARQSALNAAIAGKRAAEAGKLPVVAVAADFYNEPIGSEFPRRSNTLAVGVLVKLNVFDSGLTRARIDEAGASVRYAEQSVKDAAQSADLQVETARIALSSARSRLETTADQIAAAEESLRVLQAGYREGITPLTDVLSAESALTGARFARISAENDVRAAEVGLLMALGQTDILIR